VAETETRDRAERFIEFVRSPAGQAILVDAGFGSS
jgi:ABC-type molybdate transport system substrate-binding protein